MGKFEYGDPPGHFYDPEHSLSPEMAGRLIADLEKVNKRDHADVMVVILPSAGELPPSTPPAAFQKHGEEAC